MQPNPRAARRILPRSLTARLVTGVVALVVIVVVAVGSGTYFALRSFLYDRLGQQLVSAASSAANAQCVQNWVSGGVQCKLNTISTGQHEWFGLLRSGRPVALTTDGPHPDITFLDLPASVRTEIVSDPGQHYEFTTSDGSELRLGAQRLGPIGGYVVVIGLSTDEIQRTLGRLVTLELIIGAAAVVVAFGASTWGVRFSLRRLHEVTDTVQEVAAELSPEGAGLDRRVTVEEQGTEVGRLADSMNTLLAAVETQFAARLESEQRMRRFLADASHELRTPLTSIRGYAELARMQRQLGVAGTDTVSAEESGDNLARIEAEGTRMSRLVEDLLTLARGDQGGLPELAPVEVDELLEDVLAGSRAAFPEREILGAQASGLTVVGDHDQLLRAVRNLVSNAATHTRPDGVIALRAVPSGPGVAIQVLDEGPGLPPEEAEHVFERFWRADRARSRARGGSGLGLAIVATIVAQHGGTVQFHSAVEHGSTVTIWLPARTGSL